MIDGFLNSLFPKQFNFLNVAIYDFSFKNFAIDTSRAKFEIDKDERGIMMNWAKLLNYDFHCKISVSLVLFHLYYDLDIHMKDIVLDNGLSI